VRLIGDGTLDLRKLEVSANSRVISATILSTDSVNEIVCGIEISGNAPAGFLNGEIILTGDEGGPVVARVPVFAMIKD
jgi:hypothetical protein